MDVSQYLDIFIDESSEHIQTLSDCIMTLEPGTGKQRHYK